MKSKDIMKVANSMALGHFVLKVNTENKLGNYIKYTYSVYFYNFFNTSRSICNNYHARNVYGWWFFHIVYA